MESAKKGNVGMQIWLGKQYLGQKDVSRQEMTGDDGKPIEVKQFFQQMLSRPPEEIERDIERLEKTEVDK